MSNRQAAGSRRRRHGRQRRRHCSPSFILGSRSSTSHAASKAASQTSTKGSPRAPRRIRRPGGWRAALESRKHVKTAQKFVGCASGPNRAAWAMQPPPGAAAPRSHASSSPSNGSSSASCSSSLSTMPPSSLVQNLQGRYACQVDPAVLIGPPRPHSRRVCGARPQLPGAQQASQPARPPEQRLFKCTPPNSTHVQLAMRSTYV